MTRAVTAALLRCETRLLLRDPAFWLTLLLVVVTVGYALANTRTQLRQQAAVVAAAQADETRRLQAAQAQIADIDAGRAKPPAEPYQDPRNAIFAGSGRAAQAVHLPPRPLAPVAVGLSDLVPPVLLVSAASKDSFLFKDEIANPMQLFAGAFDLAFVLVFLLPLWIVGLTYPMVSQEREQGTLALSAACGQPLGRWLALRLALRAGVPVAATLAAVAAGLGWAGVRFSADPAAVLALGAAILLYGAFWALLAAAVNGLGRSSAWNATALVGAWIVLLLLVPAAVNALAGTLFPAPSRAEMVLAVRAAAVDAERNRDAELARFRDEHPDADEAQRPDRGREQTLRRLAVQQAAVQAVDGILASHEAQLARRQSLVQWLSFASPALLMNDALAELAGHGPSRMAAFMTQLHRFHRDWRAFFVSRAQAGQPLQAEDYRQLPRFDTRAAAGTHGMGAVAADLAGLALLALASAAAAALALRRLRLS